jgi:major membrane immunogen (membrane-anchored lipoprotein)
MIKKISCILSICFVGGFISCHSTADRVYHDGVFTGESQYSYTDEAYYGVTTITVIKGTITQVEFHVIDKARNEIFDETYEKYFKDIPAYIQQCRNDWKGIQTYPAEFLKVRNIDKVDAITGATWSYNLFRASLMEALKHAGKG